jgi:hypothetical protein
MERAGLNEARDVDRRIWSDHQLILRPPGWMRIPTEMQVVRDSEGKPTPPTATGSFTAWHPEPLSPTKTTRGPSPTPG